MKLFFHFLKNFFHVTDLVYCFLILNIFILLVHINLRKLVTRKQKLDSHLASSNTPFRIRNKLITNNQKNLNKLLDF